MHDQLEIKMVVGVSCPGNIGMIRFVGFLLPCFLYPFIVHFASVIE